MQFSSLAVMLLTLVVCLTRSQPINGNVEASTDSQGPTVSSGGENGDSSSRGHSGRHWTTSLRGRYQKIVSGGDGGRSPHFDVSYDDDDDDDVTEPKRKQRQRIQKQSQETTTENNNSSLVQNGTHNSSSNATKLETVRIRNHRNPSSRRSSNHHSVESTTRSTAASNKKRRRLSHYNVATSTAAPSQTMPHSLYSYFRPLEQDLPEDDILPFLDFGRKLSPSVPTPSSSINSIENKSSGTRSKSKDLHSTNVNINSTPVDEDVLPEDMDVTYVKKAVERNSAPIVTIQTHAPGISNYYRRRHPPAASRTADNIVVTSLDYSAPSPDQNNTKTDSQSSRKTNRRHNNGRETETDSEEETKNVTTDSAKEIQYSSANLSEKSRQVAENFTAAESSLVNSVKHFETGNSNNANMTTSKNIANNLKTNSTIVRTSGNTTAAATLRSNNTESKVTAQEGNARTASTSSPNAQLTTRILSTAVVTSVSLKESSFNNSETPVTAPPPPQSPLPTRLARVVNSTVDRTNDTSQVDNSTEKHGNVTLEGDISEEQSSSKLIPAEQSDRLNRTLVHDWNDKVPVTNITQTVSQSDHSSTVENNGKQLTDNFTSESEIRPDRSETNRPTAVGNDTTQRTGNVTSTDSETRIVPLPTNHTFTAVKGQSMYNLNSSESEVRMEPPPRSEKTGKQLSTGSTVPTEPSRLNHTFRTENGNKNLTSDSVIPVESSQTNRTTAVAEKNSDINITDNLTPVGKVDFIPVQTSLSTNRSENDGNVPNMSYHDGSVDPVPALETTTVSLWQVPALTPVTNDSSLRTSDTKDSPSTSDSPKTEVDIHEGAGNSSIVSSEVPVNRTTTDGSVYVDNNTIADLTPTDVYYDYDESNLDPPGTLSEPGYTNNDTTIAVHGEQEEGEAEEEEVDGWLQNSTVIEQNVEVAYPQPTIESSTYILVGLSIIPILLGAVVAARFFLLRNKKKVLDESEYSSEYNRSPLSISNASPLPTKLPRVPQHLGWEMEKSPPSLSSSLPSSKWEFPREKLRLQTVLGQGNFGQVWKAEADDISGHEGLTRLVAVKSVKESASAREREDLLRELGIMQDLGSHPNVVTLLGCCTEKEPYFLIMEYVMYGKLLTFLRDHRTRAHYYNFSDITDALTSRDLTVFMYCVARGMDYLTNKGIIHRDLAARNVLVDHNKLCKIADFGMSRNVRDTGQIYEQRQSKGALPIRWMAPESLHFSLFTHKSDVWSFGILLWEIITLGSTPYATMGAREVMRRVRDGYRLERPSHCRPELFRVISRCWHADPNKRPNFAELKHEIGQLLSDTERGGNYIDLDSLHEEMKQSSQRSTLQRNQ